MSFDLNLVGHSVPSCFCLQCCLHIWYSSRGCSGAGSCIFHFFYSIASFRTLRLRPNYIYSNSHPLSAIIVLNRCSTKASITQNLMHMHSELFEEVGTCVFLERCHLGLVRLLQLTMICQVTENSQCMEN